MSIFVVMKKLRPILPYLKNKYIIAGLGVLVWISFFDKYDLITQYNARQALAKLEKDKKYYTDEIKKNQEAINELKTNAQSLEKFAREKYLMKRDNEDIFLILDKSNSDSISVAE